MRASFRFGLIGGLIFLSSACSEPRPVHGPGTLPEADLGEVTAVASTFLSALSAGDTATLSGLVASGAMIHSLREDDSGPSLRAVSREAFLESLGGEEQDFLERMWNPVVHVEGGVAVVWTPYDFFLNGEFSHCGIDVFSLLKGGRGWQVTAITYNVVREGCPPSPLGPPGGGLPN